MNRFHKSGILLEMRDDGRHTIDDMATKLWSIVRGLWSQVKNEQRSAYHLIRLTVSEEGEDGFVGWVIVGHLLEIVG